MNEYVPIEAVLCTAELERRPSRIPDFAAENRALGALAQALADSPESILQSMAEVLLDTFAVGSAGCSLLANDSSGPGIGWSAVAGAWRAHIGAGTPRDFGPSGDALERNVPLLFKRPQRRYRYLNALDPCIEECLVVPFHVGGSAVGTIWLIAHDDERQFASEDLRLLLSFSRFASSAYQVTTFYRRMRSVNEALLLGSLQQHQFAEAEERLNDLLHAEIARRMTLEVELKQATITATQASLSKSDFLANMSHELRTPLSAMLGHAQVMELGTTLSDVQQRSVTQIKKGGWYLADLINEILDLAQIEAGKLSVNLEAVALADVMLECQALIEPLAKPLNVSVAFPCLESAVFVLGDRKRIKQVVINLLSNAIKYNRPGGSVTVECPVVEEDRIRISITDTGEGLSGAQMSQLFQLFNRLGKDALRVNGTGIGLVMTKRLTELMGGQVGVESTVGTGSVFWIELKQIAPPAVTAVSAPARYSISQAGSDSKKTLLYVEDNAANLLMIQDLMSHRSDIRLLSAQDGMSGISVARANRPDAILLDMRLPDIGGLQVAAILAADPATARIPVIAFSANAMPQDVSHAMEAGFFHYLTKPINVGEFMETLDRALGFSALATG